jgi:hypothetical protein
MDQLIRGYSDKNDKFAWFNLALTNINKQNYEEVTSMCIFLVTEICKKKECK